VLDEDRLDRPAREGRLRLLARVGPAQRELHAAWHEGLDRVVGGHERRALALAVIALAQVMLGLHDGHA
jgi:hypothetical protein